MFYILSVFAVFYLGKSIYDSDTGLVASFLYLLSSVVIRNAQNARMYSLLGLLEILSVLLFFHLFLADKGSRKGLAAFVLINILGTFTHYWFFFILLAQTAVCCFLARADLKKFLLVALISTAPFFLFWGPLLFQQMQHGSASWMWKPTFYEAVPKTLMDFYNNRFSLFANDNERVALGIYVICFFLIGFKVDESGLGLQSFSVLRGHFLKKENLAVAIFLVAILAVPYLVSQIRPIFFVGRYTIIDVLPVVLLLSSFLVAFANRRLLLIGCYVLFSLVTSSFAVQSTNTEQHSDKATAHYLARHGRDGDVILFTGLSQVTIDYYFKLLQPHQSFVKMVFPREISSHFGWRDVQEMLSRREQLESEADEVIALLKKKLDDGAGRIWFFNGYDTEIVDLLRKRMDESFTLVEEKDLRGPPYKSVLVYVR